MCGIVAGVAERNIVPILLEGLKRLEYRGYDSAGLAVNHDGTMTAAAPSAKWRASLPKPDPKTSTATAASPTPAGRHTACQAKPTLTRT